MGEFGGDFVPFDGPAGGVEAFGLADAFVGALLEGEALFVEFEEIAFQYPCCVRVGVEP